MAQPYLPETPADLPTPEQMAQLKGIDIMRGILAGRFPGAPIAKLANMMIEEVAEGRVVFSATPKFEHYNPMGSVHGGWFGVLLDSAMGCAVMTMLPRGKGYATLEYKVNILRAAYEGTPKLLCTGTTVHVGRRTATAEARLEDSDGKLYATGTTTCFVMDLAPT
ncbi:MAG: PaaI family thioesterase [Pseudomonadota bacterium]